MIYLTFLLYVVKYSKISHLFIYFIYLFIYLFIRTVVQRTKREKKKKKMLYSWILRNSN